ncbi:MAG: hypothetical protein EBS50_13240, partial [Sphingomonadaceae bacterium]|nr:hypothetical protein [Sphingomonadaceae bacterium]
MLNDHVTIADSLKQDSASILGSLILDRANGRFASLGLACFHNLYRKLSWYGPEYVRVVLKGNTAISLQRTNFAFSDIDIGVYINPKMDKTSFDKIYNDVKIVCGQVIAKHKQMIDRTFFRPREGGETLLNEENNQIFQDMHIKAMSEIGVTSCFLERNKSSNNSIYITKSDIPDKVVRINMPHYEHAEKIPLDFSPISCSINDTIRNVSDDKITDFSLFRIKWGNIVHDDESDESSESSHASASSKSKRLVNDFIDITVMKQDDSGLLDFWSRNGFCARSPLTCLVAKWGWKVTCTSMNECIHDLHKSLLFYDMPIEKKERKQEILKSLVC